jgi:hypothetical protein
MLLVRIIMQAEQAEGGAGRMEISECPVVVNRQSQNQTTSSQIWLVLLSQFENVPASRKHNDCGEMTGYWKYGPLKAPEISAGRGEPPEHNPNPSYTVCKKFPVGC